jgi:hypothetical protein
MNTINVFGADDHITEPAKLLSLGWMSDPSGGGMKWELTLHGGKDGKKRMVIEAETAEEARRMAVAEMKKKDALVYELEKMG